MVHESIIRGYHVYKEVWKPKIGLGSTARAMHDQHAVNSARMRLTASIKPGKYVCAYEKVCAYKKGAPNNPSLRYTYMVTRQKCNQVISGTFVSDLNEQRSSWSYACLALLASNRCKITTILY